MSFDWTQVILFGDSLTQRSFDPSNGWATHLANRLQRISDVKTRGFSGYNSRWLRIIVPKVFPKDKNYGQVSCLTILIGANDSNDVDSPTKQHIPIDEYEDNLVAIIQYLETIGITKERIVLISPPNYFHENHIEFCKQNGKPFPKKDNQTVGRYAMVCSNAAKTMGVEFLDIFTEFSKEENSEQLFCDGLHFSDKGSQLVFQLVWPLIEKRIKQHKHCTELKMNFPFYSDIDSECPEKSLLNQSSNTMNTESVVENRSSNQISDEMSDKIEKLNICLDSTSVIKEMSDNQNKAVLEVKKGIELKSNEENWTWSRRHHLFSRYKDGIMLCEDNWYSVTPEKIAIEIAQQFHKTNNLVIVDGFCGVGGNTIQFAKVSPKNRVIAIDIDKQKIEFAKHNAKIYGVFDQIEFICADYMQYAKHCSKVDAVFLSPPWGGRNYLKEDKFELSMITPNDADIFSLTNTYISPNIGFYLPRNIYRKELRQLVGKKQVKFKKYFISDTNEKVKAIVAYFGALTQGLTEFSPSV